MVYVYRLLLLFIRGKILLKFDEDTPTLPLIICQCCFEILLFCTSTSPRPSLRSILFRDFEPLCLDYIVPQLCNICSSELRLMVSFWILHSGGVAVSPSRFAKNRLNFHIFLPRITEQVSRVCNSRFSFSHLRRVVFSCACSCVEVEVLQVKPPSSLRAFFFHCRYTKTKCVPQKEKKLGGGRRVLLILSSHFSPLDLVLWLTRRF